MANTGLAAEDLYSFASSPDLALYSDPAHGISLIYLEAVFGSGLLYWYYHYRTPVKLAPEHSLVTTTMALISFHPGLKAST